MRKYIMKADSKKVRRVSDSEALIQTVGNNERRQHRFRTAVLMLLSRIDITATMIYGAQLAQRHELRPGGEKEMEEHAEAAKRMIQEKTDEMVIRMGLYVLGVHREKIPMERGKKWSGWEI